MVKKVLEICPLCGAKLLYVHAYRPVGVYVCESQDCKGQFNGEQLKKVEA